LDFLLAGLGALLRATQASRNATPRSSRLASHPNQTAKSPIYFLKSLKGSFVNNLDFLLAGLGALLRYDSLVWRATPRSSRLASHPNPTAKSPIYFLKSLKGSFVNNLGFLLAGLGALLRATQASRNATPRSSRLASHPNPTAKSPSYFLKSP